MSKGRYLGEFEHLVLLALLQCESEGYGIPVRNQIEQRTGRRVGIGSVYSTLDRLSRKGYTEARDTAPEPVRGGRSKKVYQVTEAGLEALRESRRMLDEMATGLDLEDRSGAKA